MRKLSLYLATFPTFQSTKVGSKQIKQVEGNRTLQIEVESPRENRSELHGKHDSTRSGTVKGVVKQETERDAEDLGEKIQKDLKLSHHPLPPFLLRPSEGREWERGRKKGQDPTNYGAERSCTAFPPRSGKTRRLQLWRLPSVPVTITCTPSVHLLGLTEKNGGDDGVSRWTDVMM